MQLIPFTPDAVHESQEGARGEIQTVSRTPNKHAMHRRRQKLVRVCPIRRCTRSPSL
ncbi:uncharacterized protein LAESUDRAFT_731210 [Laetiporus sulphureus 93-53]|uniref:Uncharacterized protein n=1 Tax=Laetiporus sulphureus 93-53 TaxID=1314785 RepID=A0A165BNM1_9APHY|nr:uncharacterized protein LAESUDRAFT_731210 [Laetiporus sulphureus 93-53]KZT01371.1 hypothetical protein LAESUDRAFT_731210 [Laetiporus sulphureus 93-53]